jgi:hypothetical protein
MRRVEQLTERTLSETADLAILWLALSAYAILHFNETKLIHHPFRTVTAASKSGPSIQTYLGRGNS